MALEKVPNSSEMLRGPYPPKGSMALRLPDSMTDIFVRRSASAYANHGPPPLPDDSHAFSTLRSNKHGANSMAADNYGTARSVKKVYLWTTTWNKHQDDDNRQQTYRWWTKCQPQQRKPNETGPRPRPQPQPQPPSMTSRMTSPAVRFGCFFFFLRRRRFFIAVHGTARIADPGGIPRLSLILWFFLSETTKPVSSSTSSIFFSFFLGCRRCLWRCRIRQKKKERGAEDFILCVTILDAGVAVLLFDRMP